MEGEIDHGFYPQSTPEEADAAGWAAATKESDLSLYYFKFPPIKPTQARLKVLHTSICQSDVTHLRGLWGNELYPCIAGHEVVGEITQIGSEVTSFKIGDKVGASQVCYADLTCRYCKMGYTQVCENRVFIDQYFQGGFATHLQLDHNALVKIPEGLDLKEIAPLLGAGVIVYAPLKRFQKIGGKCAVIGIGGLGHLAIQYANKLGMEVTAFTTRLENVAKLRELGASDVQHSTDPTLLRLNEGKYDIVASNLFVQDVSLHKLHQRLTKNGGTFLMVGAPTAIQYEIDSDYLVNNQITVAGTIMGSVYELQETLEFSLKNDVKSINEYYSFEDFPKAFHRVEKETPRYRCVVNVTDWAKKNGFDK